MPEYMSYTFVHIYPFSPDLIPAFKDVTLDSLKAAGVGPSPVSSAPPPPPPAAAAPPAAPGSSYPTHMKVGIFIHKQSTGQVCSRAVQRLLIVTDSMIYGRLFFHWRMSSENVDKVKEVNQKKRGMASSASSPLHVNTPTHLNSAGKEGNNIAEAVKRWHRRET